MKKPAPKPAPIPWKPTRPLVEREPDPLVIQAEIRYFDALDQGMTPIEASEVFKTVHPFLYDYIRLHGHPKFMVKPTQAEHARALRAQKVGL